MARRSRKARPRGNHYSRPRFDWRRFLNSAPLGRFLLGGLAAAIGFFVLLLILVLVSLLLLPLIGVVVMHVGGIPISAVSFVDRTTEYDAPVWFSTVKWGTLPVRVLESGLSIAEFSESLWDRK